MEKNPCHFEPTEGSVRNLNWYRRFLNRRRAPHVEMTMDSVNQCPTRYNLAGAGGQSTPLNKTHIYEKVQRNQVL